MASIAQLVGLTGFQRGVDADETAINIEEIVTTVEPEWREHLPDRKNNSRGFAHGNVNKTVGIRGEIAEARGQMAARFPRPGRRLTARPISALRPRH
jgi:hypothetical protein